MTENMKKFLEAVSSNAELVEKIKSADKESLIVLAKEMGLELTGADFDMPESQPLCDDELDAVAGGGDCWCAAGGGGTKGGKGGVCACVGAGTGGDSTNDGLRCACAFAGSGLSRNL